MNFIRRIFGGGPPAEEAEANPDAEVHTVNRSHAQARARARVRAILRPLRTDVLTLDLSDPKENVLDYAEGLAELLKTNTSLTELNVLTHDNAVCNALSEALKTDTTLTKLTIQTDVIADDTFTALCEAMKTNKTLTTLGLNFFELTTSSGAALAELLKENTALSSLDISGYLSNENPRLSVALGESLKSNTSLRKLRIECKNCLSGPEGLALAEGLKANTTLTALDITEVPPIDPDENGIREYASGGVALAGALAVNRSLSTLTLRNPSHIAFKELQDALKTNPSLRTMCVLTDADEPGERSWVGLQFDL
jgi:hypothetical protein